MEPTPAPAPPPADDDMWREPPVRVPGALIEGDPPPWRHDRRTCVHEAGHAVAALAQRMPVWSAGFVEHEHKRAEVRITITSDAAYVAFSCAGAAAEFLAWGAAGPGWVAGPLCDMRNAWDTAARIIESGTGRKATTDEVRTVIDAAQDDAEIIVRQHWPAVLAIAEAMQERRTLTAPEVGALWNAHQCPRG